MKELKNFELNEVVEFDDGYRGVIVSIYEPVWSERKQAWFCQALAHDIDQNNELWGDHNCTMHCHRWVNSLD